MSVIKPKTIFITTVQPSRLHGVGTPAVAGSVLMDMASELSVCSSGEAAAARKRRRLTHLSPDERMMRRKLKNRVAAQTARDRKKERMDHLEDAVAALEAENRRLQMENSSLRQHTGKLSNENQQLKERLAGSADAVTATGVSTIEVKSELGPCESAEGTGPGAVPLVGTQCGAHFNSQSDVLLDILKQIKAVVREDDTKSEVGAEQASSVSAACPQPPHQPLVGPATTELESIKELIKFDHIYYKPAVSLLTGKQPVATVGLAPAPATHKVNVLLTANRPLLAAAKPRPVKIAPNRVPVTPPPAVNNVNVAVVNDVKDNAILPNIVKVNTTRCLDNAITIPEDDLDIADLDLDDLLGMSFEGLSQLAQGMDGNLATAITSPEATATAVNPIASSQSTPSTDSTHVSKDVSTGLKRKLSETSDSSVQSDVQSFTGSFIEDRQLFDTTDEFTVMSIPSPTMSDPHSESGYSSDPSSPASPHTGFVSLDQHMWEDSFQELFPSLL